MAIVVKGFGVITDYDNQDAGFVQVVGELTPHVKTFTSDGEMFTEKSDPNGRFYRMAAYSETSGSAVDLPQEVLDRILLIINTIATFDAESTSQEQLNAAGLNDVTADGSILAYNPVSESEQYIPGDITTVYTHEDEDYNIRVWFADSNIRSEYDEHEVLVICPLSDVVGYYDNYGNVKPRQDEVEYYKLIAKAEEIRNERPCTAFISQEITWRDAADYSKVIKTVWPVVCYGPRATQETNILAALRDYLTENSTYSVEEWAEYFPDIVTLNIFTFIPTWNQVAVAVTAEDEGIYNPIVEMTGYEITLRKINPSLTDDQINERVCSLAIAYKSIGFLSIASDGNTEDAYHFLKRFPDYIITDTNDSNINRIDDTTREIIKLLESATKEAEKDNGVSQLPSGLTRGQYGDCVTIYGSVSSIQIEVVTKNSFNSVVT